jgi:transposase
MRRRNRNVRSAAGLPVVHEHAAGVDIGAREIFVAVPGNRDEEPVRSYPTFTADLHRLADWLVACRITTVAMEATGVYWIPLYQILEERGLEVCLVNARHFQNVPGRRTDVGDCPWLQQLHAVGLLRGSYRPAAEICALRSLWRHRESLVQMAAVHVQHMQKAFDQMNLQIHHVLSELTGVTGMAMVEAIVAGEHDPAVLAKLRQPTVRANEETIPKALTGDYRREHLFTLEQSLQAWRHYQHLMGELDQEIERQMHILENDEQAQPPAHGKGRSRPRHHEPVFDLRSHLYRMCGVDVTAVPGVSVMVGQSLLTEVGPDLSRFPNSATFCAWLGLCPQREVSGGKLLASATRKGKNRFARALRMGVYTLHHSHSPIAAYYRRMRAKLGAPKAITATAHKIARILYRMLTTRVPYDETMLLQRDADWNLRQRKKLSATAHKLGYHLVPITAQT